MPRAVDGSALPEVQLFSTGSLLTTNRPWASSVDLSTRGKQNMGRFDRRSSRKMRRRRSQQQKKAGEAKLAQAKAVERRGDKAAVERRRGKAAS